MYTLFLFMIGRQTAQSACAALQSRKSFLTIYLTLTQHELRGILSKEYTKAIMATEIFSRYEALSEAARAEYASLEKASNSIIQVGSATCENAAGSPEVWQEFERNIRASGRNDIRLHRVGCTGRCSREPIVGVLIPGKMPVKYQKVDRDIAHDIFTKHIQGGNVLVESALEKNAARMQRQVILCGARHCNGMGCDDLEAVFLDEMEKAGLDASDVAITRASGMGFCSAKRDSGATCVLVRPDNVIYFIKDRVDAGRIVREHFGEGVLVEALRCKDEPVSLHFFDLYGDIAFFNQQNRIALRNAGIIDPESIQESLRYNGFRGLAVALSKGDPNWVVEQIKDSKLRGRGGGGYLTGVKWEAARKRPETMRYLICNADEGDPGAFMDRSMLESDPFSVVEGMLIGGYAIGARRGLFYVRAEYPLAIKRIERAIEECRRYGLLGDNILGSDFSMELEVRLGAGAFVCGEETALIHSIEGERGQPRIRPPYPTDSGLWEKPTVINNVETFANVPPILVYGSDWFRTMGLPESGGTKVFALAGKVNHTGLVEVPMGTTLREVVFAIGGGVPNRKDLKAVQTGGPAGGVIPADYLDTPIDFDTLGKLGSIMGSGGMIVLDEDDCMVDVAKFFMAFCQDESCGKCTPCREGTKRMLEILERITEGKGTPEDLGRLERLANLVKKSSLCGLGRAAPNPVLSTLRFFRDEYEAHVTDRKCPAHKCKALVHYEILPDKCVGCTMCARNCPAACISGARKETHSINQSECIKCGRCFEVCRFDAVAKQ